MSISNIQSKLKFDALNASYKHQAEAYKELYI